MPINIYIIIFAYYYDFVYKHYKIKESLNFQFIKFIVLN
jgi:hypothetical protein